MNLPTIPSALLALLTLSPAVLADVSNKVPTTVSGGSGVVSAIQTDDGAFYTAAKGDTVNFSGFTAVGGDISSVVLHVKFSVDPGGYDGTNPIRVNGINTPIIPAAGDTNRTASVDITSGDFRVNTWPEITALAVSFINNDGGTGQAVLFDHAYLVITHTTPLFAPPTWSDEFDDSGPPNPAFWTFEQGFVRNEELQWYQSDNAWQQNGNLIIEGRREQVLNPNYVAGSTDWRKNRQYAQYTSSSIKSQGKFSFQYGRMQVRAKIPCFPGAWPAIWTLGDSGEWPSNGECDVLEYYATDSVLANCARGTTTRWSAWWDAVKKPVSPFFTSTNPNPNWRNEYHIWTMQWDADNVRLYIDNHLMNTTAQTTLVNPVTTWGPKDPFKQPHHLLLNLALGGAGGSPSGTTFPLRYEIDHVRVWEGLTGNNAPTDIALSSNSVPEGVPAGTVVGNLTATDVDAAEVHGFSLVSGTGSTHNSSFEVVFKSDQTKTSVLRTKAVLNSADGPTRSIRVRVTDIEGATYDKVLTVQLDGQYVIEVDPATPSIPEGGTNTFNVRLRLAPTSNVTVNVSRLSGDADLNVASGSSLVFTPANGTIWQTVTLSAAEDADRANDTATFLCSDPSNVYTNATVLATEADNEPPPVQAVVVLSNLNQTFDGFMKSVSVTTTVNGNPENLSYDLTYGGQFMNPTDAGEYEVIATITDPDYVGSASGTLVVAKAGQTITFAPLDPVSQSAPPIPLTATSSSNLPVSYTSSDTGVATVSGNVLTVVSPGSTTITALQAGNDNYNPASPVVRTFTVQAPESVTWDSNGSDALQTDGAGDWTAADRWWDGSGNSTWNSGDSATFGSGGTGGAVTLASPTTVNSLTFNSFTGAYTLGTSGRAITLNDGISMNAASGAVSIISPVALGAAQSWSNNSAGLLAIGPDDVSNAGFLLSVAGTGNTTVSGVIGGAGGLSKSGAGTLSLTGSNSYGGITTVSGGTLVLSNANTISGGTSVAATGTLQLGHATSLGSSTLTLASGATLQLRNDADTTFAAPIATAAGAVTYNFDVNNAGGAVTGKTLSRGNITFATSTANQINITGGNSYTLGLGTLSSPSGTGGPWAFTVNATTAAVTIGKFSAGSFGNALALQGGNVITLNNFESGSNGNNSVTVSGSGTVATLGTTTQTNNRTGGSMAYTLTGGTLNLTTATSLANVRNSGTASAATFTINGGTLNNTSGSALALAANSGVIAGSPIITIGGNFAFGTSTSTSANNLNLGTGAITLSSATRTVTINGAAELFLGGFIANGGFTKAGSGTLTLGAQNTCSGVTTVNAGTLRIAPTGEIYNWTSGVSPFGVDRTVTVNSGATLEIYAWQYGLPGSIGDIFFTPTNLNINGGTIKYTGVGENSGNNNSRTFTIGTGGATLDAAGSGTWFMTRHGSSPANQTIGNGLTLTLTGSGNGKYDNFLVGSGGSLAKSGSGTWTLTGTNTYTGTTTVSGGTLQVNAPGSLAAGSAVTVGTGTGGTLGGNGTINGNVTVASDGSLAPGATVGTLAIGGSLNISALASGGTGRLNFDLGALAETNDRINVGGTLTIGVGALGFNDFAFTNLGGLQVTGGTPYTLITSGGITALNTLDPSNLSGILPGGLLGTLQINGNQIELVVTSANAAPTISDIASLSVPSGGNSGPLAFTVGDEDANSVTCAGASSNTALVPNANIIFGGSGANRTVTITPVTGLTGIATITITATDGGNLSAEDSFSVTVTDNYLSWAAANNISGGENGDSDNDGVRNLVEYALVDGGERGQLNGSTITYQKRGAPYATDVSYDIEISTDLMTWTTLGKPPVVENAGSINHTFTAGSPERAMYRLKVSKAR